MYNIDSTLKSCRTNVGPILYQTQNDWHYVDTCRAYWATDLNQHRTSHLQLRRSNEQNEANVTFQQRVNKTAGKMPTFAQRMIAI